jgi:hypothetical protein
VRGHAGELGVYSLLLENREDESILVVVHRRRLIHLPDPANRVLVGKTPLKVDEIPEGKRKGEESGDAEPGENRPD